MPFTFAHPGFTLPIKKWKPNWFSTTGFVFGSIAPDMDILLRLTNPRMHIFQYDLPCILFLIFPMAFGFAIYFHLVLRNIVIDHLPDLLSKKYNSLKQFDYLNYLRTNLLKVSLSILLAIGLHLLLDLASHWDAIPFKVYGGLTYQSMLAGMIYFYMVIYIPAILMSIAGFYYILQDNDMQLKDLVHALFSVLRDPGKIIFYLIFGSLAVTIAIIKTFISGIEIQFFMDNIIINMTNGILLSFVITPTLYYIRNRLKMRN